MKQKVFHNVVETKSNIEQYTDSEEDSDSRSSTLAESRVKGFVNIINEEGVERFKNEHFTYKRENSENDDVVENDSLDHLVEKKFSIENESLFSSDDDSRSSQITPIDPENFELNENHEMHQFYELGITGDYDTDTGLGSNDIRDDYEVDRSFENNEGLEENSEDGQEYDIQESVKVSSVSPLKRRCPYARSIEGNQTNENTSLKPSCSRASTGGNPMVNSNDADFRKFHILDETDEDEDDKGAISDDSDIPDDEVEKMLEEALENRKRKAQEAGLDENDVNQPFEEKDKIVLIEKDKNHFDILPEGWMQVTHNSGMPIYLHKTTRVCTLSRPYFLGPGSARKHEIPLSAIPCLSYRRYLQKEEAEEAEKAKAPVPNNPQDFPTAKIQTVEENIESQNLKPEQLREYCERLFKFKTIRVIRFNSWTERRQYTKRKKHERQLQRPMLPDGTKLITFPIQNNDPSKNSGNTKKEWIMNPNGKSYVCILHEYVQHALKKQPSYKFTELENAATPYAATVLIDDMQYGVGYGTSKKQAKSEAARTTLEILIPEMRQKITKDEKTGNSTSKEDDYDSSFFDEIRVEDPRVAEFCAKTTEPSPHDILLTCLQRNFGLEQLKIHYQGSTLKHQMNEFTMTVGKHTATVVCRNKRDGKQRASQAILQALHPHITSWGSLLRLYGNRSVKCFKEKKLEEQEITLLQSKAAINSPNFAILNKLKTELLKLRDKRKSLKPIGVFIPPEGQQMPKLSSSNLKNVDL